MCVVGVVGSTDPTPPNQTTVHARVRGVGGVEEPLIPFPSQSRLMPWLIQLEVMAAGDAMLYQ